MNRTGRKHRYRRIIGVDAFRAHDMRADCLNNRVERHQKLKAVVGRIWTYVRE
jgi:hypothetical protein